MRVLAALALFASGCFYVEYVAQGAHGQLDLMSRAQPLDQVIRDPDTPLRTAMLLAEIPAIKMYGRSYGFRTRNNHEKDTPLPRPALGWLVGAAAPLARRPRPRRF